MQNTRHSVLSLMIVRVCIMKLKQNHESLKDDPLSELSETATTLEIVNDMAKQILY